MSLLHSFYCWGHVGVVLVSTVFFALFGTDSWKLLVLAWAAVPVFNLVIFAGAPIYTLHGSGEGGMGFSGLFRSRIFWIFMLMMVCAGASEQAVGQWASTFAEKGLGVSKAVGASSSAAAAVSSTWRGSSNSVACSAWRHISASFLSHRRLWGCSAAPYAALRSGCSGPGRTAWRPRRCPAAERLCSRCSLWRGTWDARAAPRLRGWFQAPAAETCVRAFLPRSFFRS